MNRSERTERPHTHFGVLSRTRKVSGDGRPTKEGDSPVGFDRALDVVGRFDSTKRNAILIYHSIGDIGNQPTSPAVFEAHMQYLSREFEIVDLPEIVDSTGERQIAVTFDDGFIDFYRTALPVLERYEVPATVFVCADFIDDRNRDRMCAAHSLTDPPEQVMLRRDQLGELVENRYVTVGNHTRSHRNLATVDDESDLREEIVGNQTALEETLGRPVNRFSFPFHSFNPVAREIVAETHELGLCGVGLMSTRDDRYSLPRVALPDSRYGIQWSLSRVANRLRQLRGQFGSTGPENQF